jgi:carbamoyl-phosphate synthase large subunit
MVLAGEIDLIFNTPFGVGPRLDGYEIRTACVTAGVPCVTTIQGAAACVQGIEALVRGEVGVRPLQDYHAGLRAARAAAAPNALTTGGPSR